MPAIADIPVAYRQKVIDTATNLGNKIAINWRGTVCWKPADPTNITVTVGGPSLTKMEMPAPDCAMILVSRVNTYSVTQLVSLSLPQAQIDIRLDEIIAAATK